MTKKDYFMKIKLIFQVLIFICLPSIIYGNKIIVDVEGEALSGAFEIVIQDPNTKKEVGRQTVRMNTTVGPHNPCKLTFKSLDFLKKMIPFIWVKRVESSRLHEGIQRELAKVYKALTTTHKQPENEDIKIDMTINRDLISIHFDYKTWLFDRTKPKSDRDPYTLTLLE